MINFRKQHRKIAPVLFLPLLATALTGVAFSLGENWFGISGEVGEVMMSIHEGRYLGKPLVPIYVLLVGLGLLGLLATGVTLIKRKALLANPKLEMRWFHRILAPIAFLPLIVTALTGIAYRLGRNWLGLPREQASIFLKIHQGAYLGEFLKPFYVLLVGMSLVGLLITGIQLTGIIRKPSKNP